MTELEVLKEISQTLDAILFWLLAAIFVAIILK